MEKSIKKILKRCPFVYNIADKAYDNLRPIRLKGVIMGTRAYEDYWAKRHLRKGSDWNYESNALEGEWVSGYWESRRHQHRQLLIKRISGYKPLNSLLEIGCNCGPNLLLLSKKLPEVKMHGIDINPKAVQKGRELLNAEGVNNVSLSVGKADSLSNFADKSIDIVFTDAVLIYIGPDKIKEVITEMLRVARVALVFIEQHDINAGILGKYKHGKWVRDYTCLLEPYIPIDNIHITKLSAGQWPDKDWQTKGAIIEAILPRNITIKKDKG